jgi:hypothetical protein
MKKFKNYLFGCMIIASGALTLGSGGSGGCIYCNGNGKSDCAICVNGSTNYGECTYCNGNGEKTCTFCNGTGK